MGCQGTKGRGVTHGRAFVVPRDKVLYGLSWILGRNTSLLGADSSTLHRPSNNALPYARRALTGRFEGAILPDYLVFEKWIAW